MAWDDYDVGDLKLISGDIMFCELHDAVKRIRKQYLDRFGRNPYLGELLYTLCRIASPGVVEDLKLPPIKSVLSALSAPTSSDQIDPGKYQAGFAEDGEVLIFAEPGPDLVRVQIEDNRPEEVVCHYTVFSPDISDAAARCLIRYCALRRLLKYDLMDPELAVRFHRTKRGRKKKTS
jgi:hypothetical protein